MYYLSYDIKGIQQFIFSVPRLRYIVGGSSMIIEFDEYVGKEFEECIFAAGGKGALECADEGRAQQVKGELIKQAHNKNLDLRIGMEATFSDAMEQADELHPYCPEDLSGIPCSVSGRWPVGEKSKTDIHKGIEERGREGRDAFLKLLWELRSEELQQAFGSYRLDFFRTASPSEEKDSPELLEEALVAQRALGGRNRWAIVAMDGNDMGKQFHAMKDKNPTDDEFKKWVQIMSQAVSTVTKDAFKKALSFAAVQWAHDLGDDVHKCSLPIRGKDGKRVILPFRPLVLGGDDLIIICHSSYARLFVDQLCKSFRDGSQKPFRGTQPEELWPATKGKLEMSAGVLYTKDTFPLHMGIPYAESLLKSAKGEYRRLGITPAAIDFDVVTDTLLDTPAERRYRELVFTDADLDTEVRLTQRPYLLERHGDEPCIQDLDKIKSQLSPEHVTNSARARVLPNLRKAWGERFEYLTSIRKHNKVLWDLLYEVGSKKGTSWRDIKDKDKKVIGRRTSVPDALLLLEEERRLRNPTVSSEDSDG